MYAKCGLQFGGIVEQNVVSWNALISCHVQSELRAEAVDIISPH